MRIGSETNDVDCESCYQRKLRTPAFCPTETSFIREIIPAAPGWRILGGIDERDSSAFYTIIGWALCTVKRSYGCPDCYEERVIPLIVDDQTGRCIRADTFTLDRCWIVVPPKSKITWNSTDKMYELIQTNQFASDEAVDFAQRDTHNKDAAE